MIVSIFDSIETFSMTYSYQRWTPGGETPSIIKKLIWITCGFSIFCALFNYAFWALFEMQGPQELFSLSWWGLSHSYLWQPLTFLFVEAGGSFGISFNYLTGLFFNMYLLWMLGAYLVEVYGSTHFLIFYLSTGIFAGLAALFSGMMFGLYGPIAGPAGSVLAILVVWTMLNPSAQLFLFSLFPVKTLYLGVGIVAFMLLSALSQGQFLLFLFYFFGIMAGYLYGTLVLGLKTPFERLHPLDERLNDLGRLFSSRFFKQNKGKVVDIQTGKPKTDDDAFMDEMLSKIAKRGEESLTWGERRRMDEIAAKKNKKRP